jgi:hypothetical protein
MTSLHDRISLSNFLENVFSFFKFLVTYTDEGYFPNFQQLEKKYIDSNLIIMKFDLNKFIDLHHMEFKYLFCIILIIDFGIFDSGKNLKFTMESSYIYFRFFREVAILLVFDEKVVVSRHRIDRFRFQYQIWKVH